MLNIEKNIQMGFKEFVQDFEVIRPILEHLNVSRSWPHLQRHVCTFTLVGKVVGYRLAASALVLSSPGTMTVQQLSYPPSKHIDVLFSECL